MCSNSTALAAFSEKSLIDARIDSLLALLLLIFLDLLLVFEAEAELGFHLSFIELMTTIFDCTIQLVSLTFQ